MPKSKNIALCLSGGGFRAALFHLGVLKRLHELGLLTRVRMLSAVSGGALAAALFHGHVRWPSYIEAHRKDLDLSKGDAIRERFESEGRPLTYDWESFETQLLRAARAGILGLYVQSFSIWFLALGGVALAASALCWFAGNWIVISICLSASIMNLLAAAYLYRSLLPQTRTYVRQRVTAEQIESIGGGGAETLIAPRRASLIHEYAFPLSPAIMRLIALDSLFNHKWCGYLHTTLLMCLGAVELCRGREMVFSNSVLAELPKGSRDLWEQREHKGERRGYKDEKSAWRCTSTYNIHWLPIAEAVAASSAFPPFFRPVKIQRGTELVGVFSKWGCRQYGALSADRYDDLLLAKATNRRLDWRAGGSTIIRRKNQRYIYRQCWCAGVSDPPLAMVSCGDIASCCRYYARNAGSARNPGTLTDEPPDGSEIHRDRNRRVRISLGRWII
jgi:Patatin-like phospholipase